MRITVLLDNHRIDRWIFQLIRKMSSLPDVTIEVWPISIPINHAASYAHLIFRLHVWLDGSLFGRAFGKYEIRHLGELSGVKILPETASINLNNRETFSTDLIINLSSCSPVWEPPVYGIWQCLIAGNSGSRMGLLCSVYKALIQSFTVVQVELECQTKEGKREILFLSHVPVDLNSLAMNVHYMGGVFNRMMIRQIRHLLLNRENPYPHNDISQSIVTDYFQAIQPGNLTAGFNLIKLFTAYMWKRLRSTDKWRWHLVWWKNPLPIPNPVNYRELTPPRDRFWADPFVLCRNDRTYIFMEELEFKGNKGVIKLLTLDGHGNKIQCKTILDKPYHLSYPFLFTDAAKLYMIPESAGNRTIELYSSTEPEGPWSYVMNLMENVSSRDTTLHYYNGLWWMFTLMKETDDESDFEELHLYYSASYLTTQWAAHPQNPISSDIRTSRPAGRIFLSGGVLYRPSQDCAIRYGRALNINRIIELSETEYREEKVTTLEADWKPGLKGVHTFNFDGDFRILDTYNY